MGFRPGEESLWWVEPSYDSLMRRLTGDSPELVYDRIWLLTLNGSNSDTRKMWKRSKKGCDNAVSERS